MVWRRACASTGLLCLACRGTNPQTPADYGDGAYGPNYSGTSCFDNCGDNASCQASCTNQVQPVVPGADLHGIEPGRYKPQ
jgi:hypothetical protein